MIPAAITAAIVLALNAAVLAFLLTRYYIESRNNA